MICSAFAMTTDHPDYAAMREEFLDIYAGNCASSHGSFPGWIMCSRRWKPTGSPGVS
jgi:hypothetical protein